MSPAGGVGYFVIDSLDSLLIMGLTDEYERARNWVEKLSFDIDDKFHNFEVRSPRMSSAGSRLIVNPDHDSSTRWTAGCAPSV